MEAYITFVVPAYNKEKYIGDCLESLVNQTVLAHKIIVVNDGSTDNTEDICKKYAQKYADLIKYIYQDNKGLGGARNTGFSHVDTPYVIFLDSDDWMDIKFVEKFVNVLKDIKEYPDIIFTLPIPYDAVTHYYYDWKDKDCLHTIFGNSEKIISTNAKLNPDLYDLEVSACRKVMKTSFLRQKEFLFPEHLKWEDIPGHFFLLHEANSCIAMQETGFYYRTNQGGSITDGTGKSRLDIIPIFKQLLSISEKSNFTILEQAHVYRLMLGFTKWFVESTNQEYIHPLLDQLHELFCNINDDVVNDYLLHCSEDSAYDLGYINSLKSEKYQQLSDYFYRGLFISQNVPHPGRVKRTVHSIENRGIVKTLIIGLKKVKHKILSCLKKGGK
mgnify:CR=1 FL=1